MYRLFWIPVGVIIVLTVILLVSRNPSIVTQKSVVEVSATPGGVTQVTGTTATPKIDTIAEASEATISGTIQEVGTDTIKLQTLIDPSTNKSKTYSVKYFSDTNISHKPIVIPYLLKPTKEETNIMAPRNDLKKGMYIDVITKSDITGPEIKAISLILPRIPYVIEGLVQSKNGNSLTVDAVPVLEVIPQNGKPPEHATYIITVTQNTEISRQLEPLPDGTGGQIKQFTVADLSPKDRIVIYSTADVTKTLNLTASRIEPVL
ncbi:MAG: hypothetical protein RI947_1324 [Candidatus Parcubacteria bacterium]|jgi:hypothetical protein